MTYIREETLNVANSTTTIVNYAHPPTLSLYGIHAPGKGPENTCSAAIHPVMCNLAEVIDPHNLHQFNILMEEDKEKLRMK